MKLHSLTALAVAALWLAAWSRDAEAAGGKKRIAIVVSKKSPAKELSLEEVRSIFLRQKTVWPGHEPVSVYGRYSDSLIYADFVRTVLKKKPAELTKHWLELKLTKGVKPPKAIRSTSLLKRYLERVKGGIGYLYAEEVDDSVRVVRTVVVNSP